MFATMKNVVQSQPVRTYVMPYTTLQLDWDFTAELQNVTEIGITHFGYRNRDYPLLHYVWFGHVVMNCVK